MRARVCMAQTVLFFCGGGCASVFCSEVMRMKSNPRRIARAALIAALYLLLTLLLQAISFGPTQLRVSEALMLLPVLTADAVPGLTVGCLLANLLGGGVWFDVLFGTLATLLSAWFVRRLRSKPVIAAAAPVVLNALIVGPVVYFGYVRTPFRWAALLSAVGTVALGQAVVCYVLGLPLLRVLRRIPAEIWEE